MLANSFNNMAANLKEAYDRMLQVEKVASLGKMAATVAHELNNSLSGIVQHHKGVIWLDSKPNQGTTFYIELPFEQNETHQHYNT